ncbi:MAG TPA: trypsin-like peptidase domain-containing protein [Pseudonocardiaceae bacterium]|nr:trypsin-like peptidase domain-containing protein [Pseudonocardiaceae bacterium]
MTENFPGGASEPADHSTPQANTSGPTEPPAGDPTPESPTGTYEVDQPAVETPAEAAPADDAAPADPPAAVPADPPGWQSWGSVAPESPTAVHHVDQPPAEPVAGQPNEQPAAPVYPPLGGSTQQHAGPPPQHSGPIPMAQMPASQWAPGGYGQQSGYHQVPPPGQPGYGGYGPSGPPTGPITIGYPVGGLPPEQRRRRSPGLVAGIAVLALVIGGAAGTLGGYLVASQNTNVVSSLDQQAPANQTANAPAGSVQAVANKVLPVVVTIAAEFQDQSGLNGDTGSGVVISSDGDILTNNHVIADAADGGHIQVIFASGKTVDATVVGRDPTTDIAVIKAKNVAGLPVAQLGRSASLAVGQSVVAIGAPFELSGTVTSGIVSSLHRPTEAGDGGNSQTTVLDAIQTDAPINPGNSGGPLVNMQGQVVGINSAIYSPNSGGLQGQSQGGNVGIGFAIPIDQAKRIANEIVKTGTAIQTVLGVSVEDNMPSQGGQPSILPNGALIKSVTAGGPADKAGLKAGAVVTRADGRQVNSSDGLVAAVHAAAPGDKMTLTLSTGTTVTVTLSGHPVSVN